MNSYFLRNCIRRAVAAFLLASLYGAAQSVEDNVAQSIERQVRSYYAVPARVKVILGALKPSEFSGYDFLTITFDGGEKKQSFDFLLSKDRRSLVRFSKFDLTQNPYADIMKKMDVQGRPVRGNKDAKVTVVSFDDFECPFCSRMHQTLFPELFKEYSDRVAFVYKDFPLVEIHPWALRAAIDSNCLAAQSGDAYWGFADHMHANQKEIGSEKGRDGQFAALDRVALAEGQKYNVDSAKLEACIKAQDEKPVKRSMHEGEELGVNATPTIFVNGQEIEGLVSVADLRAVLDSALKQAGVAPPSKSNAATEAPNKKSEIATH